MTNPIKVAADAVIHFLHNMGVNTFHNYPGGTIAPLLDACPQFDINVITSRHEQGAGYAALAQAKLTGLPGIVGVTSGPGVTNILTPVADAYFDSIPLLIFTGQVGTGDINRYQGIRQRGFQEVDTPLLMQAVTKAQFQPKSVSELIEILPQAWNIAIEGRKGPVSIDLPMDVQRSPYQQTITPKAAPAQLVNNSELTEFTQSLMTQVAQAKKPVIICGNGMANKELAVVLNKILARWPAAVSHSLLGIGVLDSHSPLALGFHGHTGSQVAGYAINEADLVLVLGSRLDVRQTGTLVDTFAPNAQLYRVDFDSDELTHARIKNDKQLNLALELFLPHFCQQIEALATPINLADWHQQIASLKSQFSWPYPAYPGISPVKVIETLSAQMPENTICVTGVGAHQHWVARHFRFALPNRQFFTSAGHGAMGYDLPTAIGAAMHSPESEVLCIVGDGSFQMNIQELGVITEYGLKVKIVVLDNHRLGLVSQFQLMNWDTDVACGKKHTPDFCMIAKGYGLSAQHCDDPSQLASAIEQFVQTDNAALLHIEIDNRHDVLPMLLGGQTTDKMWPYYDMQGNKLEHNDE
ncbi:thiamine pyrophosphate-binding protein [Shewanella fidelis]|uniref:Thiamine pyrophosphate-binding protein n=1 Tax=Shewanella fidelis TaxID=173509 RepID=A0AAW8NQK4_9GAMM|nr:thiamine pyrophosphate-binding protein [Shewanella fidelis]MDR8524501.1 thiamine pyrophosphate-binding protein [Shewanella fidelis]MDW4811977.1 thiamine pyrophosphate-binding protein [Shewanella fidelis]MDW4817084.1 thiamine pyrophosphate-binding protein [Shewanella fidelis]MDW4821154.1 thiamine pyrophosphate-binding protein [Shewanella fidelis]MDW4822583.1 thiamine pyrophosphate-binding protein [Shewanella fidelis]